MLSFLNHTKKELSGFKLSLLQKQTKNRQLTNITSLSLIKSKLFPPLYPQLHCKIQNLPHPSNAKTTPALPITLTACTTNSCRPSVSPWCPASQWFWPPPKSYPPPSLDSAQSLMNVYKESQKVTNISTWSSLIVTKSTTMFTDKYTSSVLPAISLMIDLLLWISKQIFWQISEMKDWDRFWYLHSFGIPKFKGFLIFRQN